MLDSPCPNERAPIYLHFQNYYRGFGVVNYVLLATFHLTIYYCYQYHLQLYDTVAKKSYRAPRITPLYVTHPVRRGHKGDSEGTSSKMGCDISKISTSHATCNFMQFQTLKQNRMGINIIAGEFTKFLLFYQWQVGPSEWGVLSFKFVCAKSGLFVQLRPQSIWVENFCI